MLRFPVKVILMCASVTSVVLGSHGLYVYFHPLEVVFGAKGDELFFAFGVPAVFEPVVEWISNKGFQSWFIPVVLIIVGIVIWFWSQSIDTRSNILRKLHLW